MVSAKNNFITHHLGRANTFWFTLITAVTAFCLYTSVYAFRKTFSVATFEGLAYFGISYKVIAELKAHSRAKGIIMMISVAGLSWFFFAIVPPPYNLIFLFTNGLPLGMVWGMVFGYMEGRRTTEVLGAALSVSFIFSGGLCRSVGGIIMRDWNVSEFWMPFVASCVFIVPLVVFLLILDKIPPPSALDEQQRTKRQPMNAEERKAFVKMFLPGIVLFVLAYTLLTTFREVRENFASDVWRSLGYGQSPGIYTATETPVSITVLIIIGMLMIVKNNKTALMINHVIILIGMMLIGGGTLLFHQGIIDAPVWMILIGTGLYLGYVPFNSVFFDRLIAAFRYVGTVGFVMYIADSFGYLGSIAVLFVKEFSYAKISWLNFFIASGYIVSVAGSLLIVGSMIYFHLKHKNVFLNRN
jgi:hypothetical protein